MIIKRKPWFSSMLGILLVLGLLVSGSGCGPESASVEIARVAENAKVWYVATTGTDQMDSCHSEGSPCKTLQWVVDHAVDGDIVHIADGIYVGRVVIGDLDITIEGSGPNTLLKNPYTGGEKVPYGGIVNLECDHCGSSVVISNLNMEQSIAMNGAGISAKDVNLSMANVSIKGTIAYEKGGCMFIHPGTSVSVDQVSLEGCRSGGENQGGGIYNQGNLMIINSNLRNNIAYDGAGLYNEAGASAELRGTLVENNTATHRGAGLYNSDPRPDLHAFEEATLLVTTSTLRGNTAGLGGGIFNRGRATILTSTISGNLALNYYGGGISNVGSMYLSNMTISGNINGQSYILLQGCCGALETGGSYSNLVAASVTIADNPMGGFFQDIGGSVYIMNSIFANNGGGPGTNQNCYTEIQLIGGISNLSDDTSCNFLESSNRSALDPLLGPLADNGGPTWTHALLPDSPAIDQGMGLPSQPYDQRGVVRPLDGNGDGIPVEDTGAFEYDPGGMTMSLQVEPGQFPTLFTPVEAGDCLAGPGSAVAVVESLPVGVTQLADGRNQGGDWIRLLRGNQPVCWVPVGSGVLNGEISSLQVLDEFSIITPTPVVSFTPTFTPTPVISFTPTFTPTPVSIVFTPNINAYCRVGPDTSFPSDEIAMKDLAYLVDGRNLESSWFRIMINPSKGCWVYASSGILSGEAAGIRVLREIPTYTPTPLVDCTSYIDRDSCNAQPLCTWSQSGITRGYCVQK